MVDTTVGILFSVSQNSCVLLEENLVVLSGDFEENNCEDDFVEKVNLVENPVVLEGDTEENVGVVLEGDTEENVGVVLAGDTEEKRGLDDFEDAVNLVDVDGDWEEIKWVEDSEVVV